MINELHELNLALRDAGIRTVADVCKASQRTIEFAPGIGAVMAAKAKRNAEAIRITVARTVRVQLDAEDKRLEQSRLILALARLMAARPYTQRAADLYSKSHGGIVTRLEVSSCIAGTLSWFFAGSEKKQQAASQCSLIHTLFPLFPQKHFCR